MTILSIAVIWFLGGLAAATVFGMTISRTNRLREDEELPTRIGAEIGYMRPNKRQTNSASVDAEQKKQPAKRRAMA